MLGYVENNKIRFWQADYKRFPSNRNDEICFLFMLLGKTAEKSLISFFYSAMLCDLRING